MLGFKLGIVIFSRQIPEAEIMVHSTDSVSVRQIFRRPEVVAFFAACMLMALAHGPYYTFYSIYLVEHGYSKSVVGWLWATGVICEIGVFFLMPQLMHRFRLKQIMVFSFGCAVARFLMIGWGVEWPAVVVGGASSSRRHLWRSSRDRHAVSFIITSAAVIRRKGKRFTPALHSASAVRWVGCSAVMPGNGWGRGSRLP